MLRTTVNTSDKLVVLQRNSASVTVCVTVNMQAGSRYELRVSELTGEDCCICTVGIAPCCAAGRKEELADGKYNDVIESLSLSVNAFFSCLHSLLLLIQLNSVHHYITVCII